MIKPLRSLVLILLVLAVGGGAWLYRYANQALPLPSQPFEFELKPGGSLRSVARQLSDARLLPEAWSFVVLARLLGKQSEIKAGNYQLQESLSPLALVQKITKGDVSQYEIRFIEGWTFRQMRNELDRQDGITHETAGLSDSEVLKLVGADEGHAEGLFFPDSYYFNRGSSDVSILKRSYKTMQRHLAYAWAERDTSVPYASPYEALIMASIVEKETGQSSERPMIAAVFVNRLRIGMRLQTDPTVIYGLGEKYDGNIHKRDLQTDTAYNTYTRAGLPPSPIAMPGSGSIQAALHPAQSKAFYFVAKGNGSHQFSETLAEHNRAVFRYQKSK